METLPDWPALTRELEAATLRLLDQARAGDWEAVAAGEPARHELAQRLFAAPIPAQAAPRVAEGVQRVLELNGQLTDLTCRSRDELGRRLGGLNQGRRAQAAYGSR